MDKLLLQTIGGEGALLPETREDVLSTGVVSNFHALTDFLTQLHSSVKAVGDAEARAARAELKNRLKMGAFSLRDALAAADSDPVVGKLKVLALLESLPGLGKVKARRVMEDVGIADSRRVQGLGAQQRQALLEKLG